MPFKSAENSSTRRLSRGVALTFTHLGSERNAVWRCALSFPRRGGFTCSAHRKRTYDVNTNGSGHRSAPCRLDALVDLPLMPTRSPVRLLEVLTEVVTPALFPTRIGSHSYLRMANLRIDRGNMTDRAFAYVWAWH